LKIKVKLANIQIEKKRYNNFAITSAERRMTMNEDILKGKWQEIRGRVKEKLSKLTGNDFGEIEGKREKFLGLLRKKYGYIRRKSDLDYKDSVELVEIVSRIREIKIKDQEIMAIAFIARYGQSLLAEKQESQISGNIKNYGYNTDRYFDSHIRRHTAHLAL
jgi:uncharacterized protein YjbJ (UPF0337 family)